MNISFDIKSIKASATRKLPFLPRFGFYLEVGGRKLTYRQAPITELIANLLERGPSLINAKKIQKEQLEEIQFSTEDQEPPTIDAQATHLP